jgi:hypothetical protein
MGLVVRVMCSCFVEGKTQPPFSGPIQAREDGSVDLDLPREGNEEKYRLFYQWLESGCEHRKMVYMGDVINWINYRSFQQTLETIGWEHFPTLRAEMPLNDQKLTSANEAPKMLEELIFFSTEANLGRTTVLVDTDTGEELQEYVAAYGGEFHVGQNGENLGVDDEGFFIRRTLGDGPKEVFRAMRIEQKIPDPYSAAATSRPMVEFINVDSGLRYSSCEPIVKIAHWPDGRLQNDEGQIRLIYPARLHVMTRKREVSDFEHVLQPLRDVFEAAIKTGNPIYW